MKPLSMTVTMTLLGVALSGRAWAQDAPKPPEPAPAVEAPRPAPPKPPETIRPRRMPTLLRVQIVISRYQGDRKVASVPYTMLLTTDEKRARLRMGVEVPVPVTSFLPQDGKPSPATSFQYKNVGTNIDTYADDRSADGLFQLSLSVESSSIYTSSDVRTAGGLNETGLAPDRPLFRTFNVNLNPTLRDGQTVQTVASTDPVTGEVVKIDVTLNVVK